MMILIVLKNHRLVQRAMLKTQMQVLRDAEDETNPFSSHSVADSDVEEAASEVFMWDDDDIEDDVIDVEDI